MSNKCGSRENNNIHSEEGKRETSKILPGSSNSEVKTVVKLSYNYKDKFAFLVCKSLLSGTSYLFL